MSAPEQDGQSHSSGARNAKGGAGRRADLFFRLPFRPRLTGLMRLACPPNRVTSRTPAGRVGNVDRLPVCR